MLYDNNNKESYTKEEQLQHCKNWIAALRSGKYKQGKKRLKEILDKPPSYCCLGVACDISNIGYWADDGFYVIPNKVGAARCGTLPSEVQRYYGIADDYGRFDLSQKDSLSYLNDRKDYSFEEIADVIEKALQTEEVVV